VFIDNIPGELPPKRGDDDHAIELIPGSSPPSKPPYRVSQAQQEEIRRQVKELFEKGMVRPSSSPFCSPVLLVHKKDDTYRMCVDYRALNKITIKNKFLRLALKTCKCDACGDCLGAVWLQEGHAIAYHQIRIVNEDILKTAFRTTFGLYEYLVMPFGLTNAPATFNRMMERIFRPHRNFTGVFFDDVIIYSKSMEEHKKHLQCAYSTSQECASALITAAFTIVAFILGVVTSVLFGFFGMRIATYANARTTLEARKGVGKAFIVAFCSGSGMGFLLAANGLLVLYITINLFKIYYGTEWEGLLEAIGYGLVSSFVALFGRVGGGIYTKAADVRVDLVGKVERGIPKDDPRNPIVIVNNVGENVGDIAGMGSVLFGSFAKSTCATLVMASISSFGTTHDFTAMCFSLIISSM
ncbi:hypothetical protein L7F22_036196, partial [Adiantum nelumboides]|nr:hypothetical protein [Adiantum nelumboides]